MEIFKIINRMKSQRIIQIQKYVEERKKEELDILLIKLLNGESIIMYKLLLFRVKKMKKVNYIDTLQMKLLKRLEYLKRVQMIIYYKLDMEENMDLISMNIRMIRWEF